MDYRATNKGAQWNAEVTTNDEKVGPVKTHYRKVDDSRYSKWDVVNVLSDQEKKKLSKDELRERQVSNTWSGVSSEPLLWGYDDAFTELRKSIQDDKNSSNSQLLSKDAAVSSETLNGKDVWKITGPNKLTTAWVSKGSKPELLKTENYIAVMGVAGSEELSSATFMEFNRVATISEPEVPVSTQAQDLDNSAKSNAKSAESATLTATIEKDGETASVSRSGSLDGSNQHQTSTTDGHTLDEYIVDGTLYQKGDRQAWENAGASEQEASTLKDHWWSSADESGHGSAAHAIEDVLTELSTGLVTDNLENGYAEVLKTTTNGKPTYTIKPRDPAQATLVVTRSDTPQIVTIRNFATSLGQKKTDYHFSRWNSVKPFTAPSGAKARPNYESLD